jgi:O-acetyl-ADP-ribose deacetylase (regulator of RNase III)
MGQVFLSHVAEDFSVVKEIAAGLERAGFTTWYYEEHSVPGVDHMRQTREAVQEAEAVAVLISRRSLGDARYVWPEIRRGVISRRHFVPLLLDVEWDEIETDHPDWDDALGGAVAIHVPSDQPSAIVPRIIAGLERLGIRPAQQLEKGPTDLSRIPSGAAFQDLAEQEPGSGTEVEVREVDIMKLEVDAITISADSRLGGDFADAVAWAAGRAAREERERKAPIRLGEAVEVPGGDLPARWVIFAATIPPTPEVIRSGTRSALRKAEGLGARSVALVGFGTGGGGFPLSEAARIEAGEVRRHIRDGSPLGRVVFAVVDVAARAAFERAVAESQR